MLSKKQAVSKQPAGVALCLRKEKERSKEKEKNIKANKAIAKRSYKLKAFLYSFFLYKRSSAFTCQKNSPSVRYCFEKSVTGAVTVSHRTATYRSHPYHNVSQSVTTTTNGHNGHKSHKEIKQ